MRDSFIFYKSWHEAIKQLPAEIRAEVYTAVIEYSLYGTLTDNMGKIANAIFTLIKPQIDVNNVRYENGCKGADYGKLGGRPKGQDNPEITPKKPQNNPNETPNEYDNDDDNVLKEKLKKENFSFESVWELYGRKGNKKTSLRRWANLKNHCREAALKHIPEYVKSTPELQFRKNFEVYLNNECWNDEIIKKQEVKNETNSRIFIGSQDYGQSTI